VNCQTNYQLGGSFSRQEKGGDRAGVEDNGQQGNGELKGFDLDSGLVFEQMKGHERVGSLASDPVFSLLSPFLRLVLCFLHGNHAIQDEILVVNEAVKLICSKLC